MGSLDLKTMPGAEKLEADYISFYREAGSHTYYVIDQELRQVYQAHPTMNGDFNYVPVSDAELPSEVLQVVQDIRGRWLAA
ncbi:MAG TPA: hypothetical protein VGL91_00255 [Acidobacteriota bacterium]|jgi:hypothetical protein